MADDIIQSVEKGDIRRALTERGLEYSSILNIFRGVTDAWKLTNAQRGALLGVSASTYRRWKSRTPQFTDEQILRVSYLLNLYLDLQAICDHGDENDTEEADSWVKAANRDFGGRAPIDVMIRGTIIDVFNVFSYVHGVAD